MEWWFHIYRPLPRRQAAAVTESQSPKAILIQLNLTPSLPSITLYMFIHSADTNRAVKAFTLAMVMVD